MPGEEKVPHRAVAHLWGPGSEATLHALETASIQAPPIFSPS